MISRFVVAMFLSVAIASISQVLLKISAEKYYKTWVREYAYSGMDYKNGPIIESLGNVFVLVLGYFVFGEKIRIQKFIGIVCIMTGIILFNV